MTCKPAARISAVAPPIPPEYDDHRDAHWRREATRQVESVFEAERFIDQVGFAVLVHRSVDDAALGDEHTEQRHESSSLIDAHSGT